MCCCARKDGHSVVIIDQTAAASKSSSWHARGLFVLASQRRGTRLPRAFLARQAVLSTVCACQDVRPRRDRAASQLSATCNLRRHVDQPRQTGCPLSPKCYAPKEGLSNSLFWNAQDSRPWTVRKPALKTPVPSLSGWLQHLAGLIRYTGGGQRDESRHQQHACLLLEALNER